jgi:20S proteasome subunit alpha 7
LYGSLIHSNQIVTHFYQATAGLLADGRQLANRARDESLNYRDSFRQPVPLKVRSSPLAFPLSVHILPQYLADRLGLYTQVYTLYSSVRPFGISTIVGGIDESGPSLYVIEPSGVFFVSPTFAYSR